MPPSLSTPVARAARGPALAALLALAPAAVAAQGSIGAQGFGYPTGQLSTRALGTGGALGEFDPASPLNPAAVSYFRRSALSVQYDPEFRRVSLGDVRQDATIARFPVISVGLPVRDRYAVGISASTLLDRTFTTRYETSALIGSETVTASETVEARGSIADVRLSLGAIATRWLRVGLAGHVLTGENRLVSGRAFPDTSRFGSVSDTSSVDFSGAAASVGVEVTPLRGVALAASARRGFDLRAQRGDTTIRRGSAPDRLGIGVRFDRVTGASFAVGYARTDWTRMRGLGSDSLQVNEGDELFAGVEAVGPGLGETPLLLRLGGRQRTLPFGLAGSRVRERAFSGGFGIPFVGGRAIGDLALQYAARRFADPPPAGSGAPLGGARERAWTLSVGFVVRP